MRKIERQEKRKGKGLDPDLEWLINNQADALQILAGATLFLLSSLSEVRSAFEFGEAFYKAQAKFCMMITSVVKF